MTRSIDRALLMVGAVVLIIGSFMTWISVDLGFTSFSATGTENIEGKLTVGAGVAILLVAAAMLTGRVPARAAGFAALAAAVFGALVLLLEYLDVRERIAESDPDVATAVVGGGVWTAAIGSALALAGAIWYLASRRA